VTEVEALQATDLAADYRGGRAGEQVRALAGVSQLFAPGTLTAITGPSGSGKTTLLHCLTGIVRPTAGTVRYAGTTLNGLDEPARDRWRRRHCGLVFQDFRLLDELDAIGNVTLPALFDRYRLPPALRERARQLLDGFGVPLRAGVASRLSRGERQRVALARALLLDPPIVAADEPTASLDAENAEIVARELIRLAREERKIVVCVTHDGGLVERADAVVALRAGREVAHEAPVSAAVKEVS
jgi:putative ABC transport system ATP-binding protein